MTDALRERVARAIHEGRSGIPWECTSQQDLAYRDANAALSIISEREQALVTLIKEADARISWESIGLGNTFAERMEAALAAYGESE